MKKNKPYDSEQDTLTHKDNVERFIQNMIDILLHRANHHDNSKLNPLEKPIFDKYSPKLSTLKFGSPEYLEIFKEMDVAIQEHYSKNKHHPEHFKNGIDDMNLFDLLEMLADWKSSSLRTHGGSFKQSFDICCKKFKIEGQRKEMLKNTVIELGWLE